MQNVLDYEALGMRIRKRRKMLGLTQGELSALVQVSLSFIGHIERGSRKASVETLVRIAIALKTSVDDLLPDSARISHVDDATMYHLMEIYRRTRELETYIQQILTTPDPSHRP